MKRFFFDLSNSTHNQYDYHGREFERLEEAHELAELIALDLQCSASENWEGFEVKVRNTIGNCLISIPVQAPDLLAA
jgi:hypothetical protein